MEVYGDFFESWLLLGGQDFEDTWKSSRGLFHGGFPQKPSGSVGENYDFQAHQMHRLFVSCWSSVT